MSYARLERLIHNASRMAIAAGLRRRNAVTIFIEDAILNAAVLLGLTRIGVVSFAGRRDLPKDLTIDALVTDKIMMQPLIAARVIWWTRIGRAAMGNHSRIPDFTKPMRTTSARLS